MYIRDNFLGGTKVLIHKSPFLTNSFTQMTSQLNDNSMKINICQCPNSKLLCPFCILLTVIEWGDSKEEIENFTFTF